MAIIQPDGYLSVPRTGRGPGVLVLHAWWGLNATMKGVCDRLAEAGFVAFAPDLYHGKVAQTIPEAEALSGTLNGNWRQAAAEIAAAGAYLNARAEPPDRGVAVLAFSLGAHYALHLAAGAPDLIHAVVLFYGAGPGDYSAAKAAYLGHFAENDPYETPENVDALEAELRDTGHEVTFYRYPGTGHWFFEPDRPDAYDPSAAALAWERTLAFLRQRAGMG